MCLKPLLTGGSMKFSKYLVTLAVCLVGFSALKAQGRGLFEPAFARPQGAFLVEEINFEPERFFVLNKDEKIRVAGVFGKPNLSPDGRATYSTIVWGERFRGAICVSRDKDQLVKAVDIIPGAEVIATGTATEFLDGWLYLEQCTIDDDVTLFHGRDPKLILGSWCGVANGRVFRKREFVRDEDGSYLQTIYDPHPSGKWEPWTIGTKKTRVKRVSADRIETAFIGPRRDYSFVNFRVLSHNRIADQHGDVFHRCQ